MNIKISTGFSKGRVENFYKFHSLKIAKTRYLFYVGVLSLLLVTILFATVFESYKHASMIFIISIIANLILIFSRPYRIYMGYKKAIKESPLMSKTYHVIFREDGIEYILDGISEFFSWSDIITIREIVDVFYVYVGEHKAIIVPKYTIERNEREKLVEFLKNKVHFKKHKFGQISGE